MFRVAKANDLLKARAAYPERVFTGVFGWSLKQMGALHCYSHLIDKEDIRCLELGGGDNPFFDNNLPASQDYWMMDTAAHYGGEIFDRGVRKRTRTTHVDALLGDKTYNIEDGFFDAIFSVSVLEHIPADRIQSAVQEMHRLLKPGGVAIHSLDWVLDFYDPLPYYDAFKAAGFTIAQPMLDLQWSQGKQTLLEPLEIVARYYGGKKRGTEPRTYSAAHVATVLIRAIKPASDTS